MLHYFVLIKNKTYFGNVNICLSLFVYMVSLATGGEIPPPPTPTLNYSLLPPFSTSSSKGPPLLASLKEFKILRYTL